MGKPIGALYLYSIGYWRINMGLKLRDAISFISGMAAARMFDSEKDKNKNMKKLEKDAENIISNVEKEMKKKMPGSDETYGDYWAKRKKDILSGKF